MRFPSFMTPVLKQVIERRKNSVRLAMISFTQQGGVLAEKIEKKLVGHETYHDITRYTFWKYPVEGGVPFEDGTALAKSIFVQYDGLVFIAAAGIAVRLIAPYVTSKLHDPAVLCIDEQGKFVVSLLSGHIGGANALTKLLADCIAACPVITTATDVGERFSPDSFAAANHLKIESMDMAKEIAAAIVRGEKIGLFSEFPCTHIPRELVPAEYAVKGDMSEEQIPVNGICISREPMEMPFCNTLYLTPKNMILGVGCKRNTKPDIFEAFILKKLTGHGIAMDSVRCICSIDLKKGEEAILQFARKYHIPFETCSAKALMEVQGEFTASAFVEETTGADNVCERSAMRYGGRLVLNKQAENGITLAVAEAEIKIDFYKNVLDLG